MINHHKFIGGLIMSSGTRFLLVTLAWAIPFGLLMVAGDWLFGFLMPLVFLETRVNFLGSLYSELIGILGTIIIVDRLNAHRTERALQEDLIAQVGSHSNEFALYAIERLRKRGWLIGKRGRLSRLMLERANLRNVDLRRANLFRTQFIDASLQGALLNGADLREAQFRNTDLCGADLRSANLLGASFHQNTRMDERTILPDGSTYNPAWDVRQLERFTRPDHHKLWSKNGAAAEMILRRS